MLRVIRLDCWCRSRYFKSVIDYVVYRGSLLYIVGYLLGVVSTILTQIYIVNVVYYL